MARAGLVHAARHRPGSAAARGGDSVGPRPGPGRSH